MFLLDFEQLPVELRAHLFHSNIGLNQMLYRRGDPATAVFALEKGRMQLFSYTTEGKRVPLYVVRPGECISEAALYAEFYCSDVVAEVPSRVVAFPKKVLLETLRTCPDLAAAFATSLTMRFNILRVRLELRNLRSARERILQYLALTAPTGQNQVELDRPLKSIADDLGLTHESFYRTLTKLVKEGVITRNKDKICSRHHSANKTGPFPDLKSA